MSWLSAEPEKPTVISAKKLQGKELSYNNFQDLESAWRLVQDFDNTACAVIKHSNPCGCAEGENVLDAYKKALACDPVSAFGGIVAINRTVDENVAQEIVKIFTECIIAPKYYYNSYNPRAEPLEIITDLFRLVNYYDAS